MTIAKFALFALFAATLGLPSLNVAHAKANPTFAAPSIAMQTGCPEGKVWSQEKQRCVPRPPRGSY